MNCEFGRQTLDDYFDQALDASGQTLLLAHCRQCAECRAAVQEHTHYLLMLKSFKFASPGAAPVRTHRETSSPAVASLHATRKAPRLMPLLLRSAAAVTALAVGIGWYHPDDSDPAAAELLSKVNIVIQVPAALDDARLTVSLPQGIYLQGHDDVRSFAWEADFAQGTNALELPLRIDSALFDRSAPQYLDATLEYQGAAKNFEFLVDLDEAVAGTF